MGIERASWFETRGVAALLTMRVQDLILRSGVSRVSKDETTELENALTLIPFCGKYAPSKVPA